MSDDVAREWSRLEAWLRSNAPPLHARLAPGATAEGLARTEERLGRPLPPQAWLAHWTDALERGEYTFDPDRERLSRRDGAAPR